MAYNQLGSLREAVKVYSGGDLGTSNTPPLGTMWNQVKWGVGCCTWFVEWEREGDSNTDWVGNWMAADAVAHELHFNTIIMFVERKGYACGVIKLIWYGSGWGEAAVTNEECGVREAEGSRMGVRASPEVFTEIENE